MTFNKNLKIDPEMLRHAMRRWVTGVSIVTSAYEDQRHGMTVNSFTSISLDPPTVLVSLAMSTRTHALIRHSGAFAVTILSEEQVEVADRFAGRLPESADRFVDLDLFTLSTGAPFIKGGLAFIDCEVKTSVEIGHSTVFFGEVVALGHVSDAAPLAYFNRLYRKLQK